jgi:hypothetical protein
MMEQFKAALLKLSSFADEAVAKAAHEPSTFKCSNITLLQSAIRST